MNPTTTWLADIEKKHYPPLSMDTSVDVVIIGGGMAGSISAYLLAKEGKKVVLIDKGDVENATTAYTTAWITTDLDTDWSDLSKMFGNETAKGLFASGKAAIDSYEKIIKEEGIDCEFIRASVFEYATDDKEARSLEEEYATIKDLGLDIKLRKEAIPGFKNISSLETPHQAKFHPLKFLTSIQEAAIRYGASIYHHTEAVEIQGEGNGPVIVTTKSGNKITADWSIMATYQPFKNPIELFARKGMYKSYVFEAEIPKGIIEEGMYEDTHNPYHYFRIDPKDNFDRMIVGGEDHRLEIPFSEDKSFRALEEYVKDALQGIEYKITKRWTGNVLENVDGLPYIGRFSKEKNRQLVATAFSGTGMHFSMISGQVFQDIILDRTNQDIALYDASREVKARNFWKKFIDFAGELFGGLVKNLFK
jgi:glycine/D-amino acid oxidase-like deaminating enzyme